MPDLLNRKNRGGTLEHAFPTSACVRPVPLPQVVLNDYLAHRLTFDVPRTNRLACDCGDAFDSATELERHQSSYRHRVPDFRPRRLR